MTLEQLAVDATLVVFATYALWKPLFVGNGQPKELRESLAYAFAEHAAQRSSGWRQRLDLVLAEVLECEFCSSFWLAAGVTSLYLISQEFRWGWLAAFIFVLAVTGMFDVLRTHILRTGRTADPAASAADPPGDSGTHGYDYAPDLETGAG
jgi:hypothetical protein